MSTITAENRNYFAMSFPVLDGEVVMQGHADYCVENGHATRHIAGIPQNHCPRCGTNTSKG